MRMRTMNKFENLGFLRWTRASKGAMRRVLRKADLEFGKNCLGRFIREKLNWDCANQTTTVEERGRLGLTSRPARRVLALSSSIHPQRCSLFISGGLPFHCLSLFARALRLLGPLLLRAAQNNNNLNTVNHQWKWMKWFDLNNVMRSWPEQKRERERLQAGWMSVVRGGGRAWRYAASLE